MTNILKISLFFSVSLVLSCITNNEKPAKLVPEDKMVQVLADIHVVDAKLEGEKLTEDSLALFIDHYHGEIFKKYGVREEAFKTTFKYYEHEPKKMDELYEKVVSELSKREADLQGRDSTATPVVQP